MGPHPVTRGGLALASALVLLLGLLGPAAPAQAATFTVTTTADAAQLAGASGQCVSAAGCTLRAAIKAARDQAAQSATTNTHLINLDAAGTYALPLGQLTIDGTANGLTVVIANTSGGSIALDGGGASRVFDVGTNSAATLYVDGVTIRNGHAGGSNGGGIRGYSGPR